MSKLRLYGLKRGRRGKLEGSLLGVFQIHFGARSDRIFQIFGRNPVTVPVSFQPHGTQKKDRLSIKNRAQVRAVNSLNCDFNIVKGRRGIQEGIEREVD